MHADLLTRGFAFRSLKNYSHMIFEDFFPKS